MHWTVQVHFLWYSMSMQCYKIIQWRQKKLFHKNIPLCDKMQCYNNIPRWHAMQHWSLVLPTPTPSANCRHTRSQETRKQGGFLLLLLFIIICSIAQAEKIEEHFGWACIVIRARPWLPSVMQGPRQNPLGEKKTWQISSKRSVCY